MRIGPLDPPLIELLMTNGISDLKIESVILHTCATHGSATEVSVPVSLAISGGDRGVIVLFLLFFTALPAALHTSSKVINKQLLLFCF